LEKVKELLEDTGTVDEMAIVEWLRRLSLEHLAPIFIRHEIFFVSDLRHFGDEREFPVIFPIEEAIDLKRILTMMNTDDKLMQQDF